MLSGASYPESNTRYVSTHDIPWLWQLLQRGAFAETTVSIHQMRGRKVDEQVVPKN